MLRSRIALIVSSVLFFSIFTAVIGTTNANAATIQIPCGPGVSYRLDTSTGVASDGAGCTHSLTLDSRVTSIVDYAFAGSYLETLTTNSALISIGKYAFNGQPLTSLTLNSALKSIGEGAFSGSRLTSLTLNSALTSVGSNAFRGVPLRSLTLNSALTSIGDRAFYDALLTSLTLNSSLTSIDEYAFYNSPLTSLTLNSALTSIGDGVFGSANLTSLTLNSALTSIGTGAFYNSPLTSLTLNSVLTSIGEDVFRKAQLSSLTVGSAVTSIGKYAFSSSPLTSLTLNSALTSIGDNAFDGSQLSTLTLNSSLTSIGNYAFYNSPLMSLTLNSALTSVGEGAFYSASIPGFILSLTSETVTVGTAITGYTISSFGAPIVSYSISPAIGNDLSFDTSTGLISGTPSTAVNLVTYTITGTNTAGSTSRPYSINIKSKAVSTPTTPDRTSQEVHEGQVEKAKNEILASINSGKLLNPDLLLRADFFGATLKNIGDINNEISSLEKSKKTDLKEIGKIVEKYATVDRISKKESYYFPDLIKIGLADSKTPNRASILRELKGLNSDQLDTFEKIQSVIKNVQAKIAERKAMIESRLARLRK
jgi:hypothetical protein